jgi:hypothetical protein
MGLGISHVVKFTSIVGKRFLYIGRKHGSKAISARVSPYIIDIMNNPVISYEHIHTICNMMAETELLAGVIRFVSVILSIKRFL